MAKLAASPAALASVMEQVKADIAARQAAATAEIRRVEAEGIVTAFVRKIGEICAQLIELDETLDRIAKRDREVRCLARGSYAAVRNGHLEFVLERFAEAIGGNSNV